MQRNGRSFGVGSFSFVRLPSGSGNFSNIARFDTGGSVEQMWPTGSAFDGAAYTVALAEGGRVWVGGDFLTYNGVGAQRLIRLNGDAIPLAITLQPKSLNVNPGATVLLKSRATGTSTISYEWRRDGTPLTNGGRISGADTAELTIANAGEGDEGAYTLRVTNLAGEEISTAAQLVVLGAPEILAEPAATGTAFGNRGYVLTVSARGVAPLNYQWRRNEVPLVEGANGITGTTTDRLVFASLTEANAGTYDVIITNGSGTVTSATFNLVVTPHPTDRHPTFSTVTGTNPTTIYSILPLPDGGALLGGSFNSIVGASSTASGGRFARVLPNGQIATLPVAIGGNVRSMALQPDGKILIGGEFTTITPSGQSAVTRNRIARLNADFTLDLTFDVGAGPASQVVSVIKVDSLGRIYAGGSFAAWGGRPTGNYLVRLRPDGSIDPAFSTPLNNYVNDVEIDATGRVYIAGQFTNYQGGSSIVRLQADGSRDTTFTSAIYGTILDIALTGEGRLLAVVNGEGLRRLLETGSFDSSFPNTNQTGVGGVAQQADGKILVAGSFTSYGGFGYRGLVRLTAAGAVDPLFEILGNTVAGLVRVDGYGRIWAGGTFTVFNNVITNVRSIYVMNGDAIPVGFVQEPVVQFVEPGQNATFTAIATGTSTLSYRWLRNGSELSDGGNISGATTATLAIANAQVTDEAAYSLRITNTAGTRTSSAAELVVLGQPEVLIAPAAQTLEVGQMASFYVQARGAGTLTYQWLKNGSALTNGGIVSGADTSSLTLSSLALTDGSAYSVRITGSAGSTTTSPVTLTVNRNPAGVAAGLTLPTFNNAIYALLPNSDGSFFAGGFFTSVSWPGGSSARGRFAKINTDGTADNTWPVFSAQVNAIAKDSTGRVYVGGGFTTVTPNGGSAVTRNRLVRLNADGTLDTTFNAPGGVAGAGPSGMVKGIKLDPSGRVYIFGEFQNYNGVAANFIARLNEDGSRDTAFVSPLNSFVYDIEFTSNGKLWIGHGGSWSGQFSLVLVDDAGTKDAGFTYSGMMASGIGLLTDNTVLNISSNYPYLHKVGLTGAVTALSAIPNNQLTHHAAGGSQFYLHGPSVSTFGGTTTGNLLRVNSDGTLDTTFAGGVGFNGSVETMIVDSSGRLWVGGSFVSYNGDTTLTRLVVLNGGEAQTNSGPPPDAFANYLTAANVPEGQRGPNDDPDGDGISNLLEYALALEPMIASATGLPEVLVVSNRLTFVYERAREDVTYTVETTTDLANPASWTTTGVDQGTPDCEGVTIASVPMDVPARFLRLKVER